MTAIIYIIAVANIVTFSVFPKTIWLKKVKYCKLFFNHFITCNLNRKKYFKN